MSLLDRVKRKVLFWKRAAPTYPFAFLFTKFQNILSNNNEVLEMMAAMGDKLSGDYVFDRHYIETSTEQISDQVLKMIRDLNALSDQKYVDLYEAFDRIHEQIVGEIEGRRQIRETRYTFFYNEISMDDVEAVGTKNANLGEIRNVLELQTPDGFAITTRAFHDFLEHNHLIDFIEKEMASCYDAGSDVEPTLPDMEKEGEFVKVSDEICRRILEAKIPPRLKKEIMACVEELKQKYQRNTLYFAVRSSAWGEDTEHSFAGQYKTVLNVLDTDLLDAYKKVVASIYGTGALKYRLIKDFQEHEIAMAVGCQLMIDPKSSGVLYTLDPSNPELEHVVIGAVWGLGAPMVEGKSRGDHYLLGRNPPHPVAKLRVVRKTEMLVAKRGGGTEWVPVPEEDQHKPCPGASHLQEIVQTGLLIERYYKRPQDVEWAIDEKGGLIILQTRALKIPTFGKDSACEISDITSSASVIFADRGVVVQRGIATGSVFVVHNEEDLQHFPHGAILVTKQTSPRLAQLMRKVHGIITDVGSPTGHLATVAREFRVPTIVNTGVATQKLKTGDEITLDATENIVYRGIIKELCSYEFTVEEVFEESYEYRLLSRIIKKISPLNLVDPHSPDFSPAGCQTYHDITRFVHEKAVEELIQLSNSARAEKEVPSRRLKLTVPLGVTIIDVDGGIDSQASSKAVQPEEVVSIPMRAFLVGLTESNMWTTEPVSVDLGSFMSSVTRTFSSSMAGPEQVGRNLAVVSRNYMNLNLRLGYHFNIIDAYISENINDNLIYFRFLGGVTDLVRRSRRAHFISEVLGRFDFRVEIRGDLVVGRVKKLELESMQQRMKMLGALVAYTRQLDVQLDGDEQVVHHFDVFMSKVSNLIEQEI